MPDLIDDQATQEAFEENRDDSQAQALLIKRVKAMLGPFVLRRLKSQVRRE